MDCVLRKSGAWSCPPDFIISPRRRLSQLGHRASVRFQGRAPGIDIATAADDMSAASRSACGNASGAICVMAAVRSHRPGDAVVESVELLVEDSQHGVPAYDAQGDLHDVKVNVI